VVTTRLSSPRSEPVEQLGWGISLTDLVNEKLSVQQLVSAVNLGVFCQKDGINDTEKARLRSHVDEGTALFDSVENWRSHYKTQLAEHGRRTDVSQIPRVADAPDTYLRRTVPSVSRRKRPRKR
jgi:hypothetical protein